MRLAGKPQSGFIEMKLYERELQEGEILLSKAMFLNNLANSKAALKSITLIPGETSYFLLKDLSSTFNLNFEKLQDEYNKISPFSDGVIMADTYNIPYHANEEFVISHLINTSLKIHKDLALKYIGAYIEKEWFKIISKASIIQKEAGSISEMPLVSSVIDNRIKKNMPLQMDGSLNYGKYSHIAITPSRIKNDNTEFNTYKFVGIPNTPSGSVSIDSIKAALNPAKTDFLYFVRVENGVHKFSSTYKEHLEYINVVKKNKNIK